MQYNQWFKVRVLFSSSTRGTLITSSSDFLEVNTTFHVLRLGVAKVLDFCSAANQELVYWKNAEVMDFEICGGKKGND